MSEEYYKNFEPKNEDNTSSNNADYANSADSVNTENTTADFMNSATSDNEPTPAERVFNDSYTDSSTGYDSIYSDSSAYAKPDYSEPNFSQEQEQSQPETWQAVPQQTEAWNLDTEPKPAQSDYYSQPTGYSATPTQPTTPYSDGYYHHSFTGDTSGNNVNYTNPIGGTSPYSAQHASEPSSQKPPKQKKKRSGGLSKGGIALLLVVCLLISGAAGFGGSLLASSINSGSYTSTDGSSMVIHKVSTEVTTDSSTELVDKTTSEIAEEVSDTVVAITTEIIETNSYYNQYVATGAGSGVIISSDGYIITNNHVIEDASSITVTLYSGETYTATLVGTDSEVDIALLKIDATDLTPAVFGDSDTLTVGSKAVIIGNPLGTLGGSVTEGIISALDRTIVIDDQTMHLLQTDAAINPGNSGGGMFNGQGELTGIVVAKSSSSSNDIDNIGFVIPINSVLDILSDLKDYGYVRGKVTTGMSFVDLSNQMYSWYYYGSSTTGVYISSVDSNSNAYSAGFRQGDRVISVDGISVSSASDIDSIISDKSVGDTVTFVVERNGSQGSIDLVLSEYVPTTSSSSTTTDDSSSSLFGGSNGSSNGGFGGSTW